jgi:hypothetical protein
MRRALQGIVGLSLPLLVAAPAPAQDDPKAIIEKAIKAHGGEEKMLKMAMVRTKGTGALEVNGVNVTATVDSISTPDKLRTDMSLDFMGQQITTKQVFDGEKGWVSGIGMTLELTGPLLEELKQTVAAKRVESLVPLLRDKMYTLSPAGETTVDGKKAVGVKVSAKGLRDSTLYFDKDSGLLVKSVRRMLNLLQKEVEGETIYSDFKDIGGVKVATKMIVHQDGKKFMEAQITEVKVLDKVEPSDFAKP